MSNIFLNVVHYFVLFGGMPTNTSINKKWNQIDNHQPRNYMQLNKRCTKYKILLYDAKVLYCISTIFILHIKIFKVYSFGLGLKVAN